MRCTAWSILWIVPVLAGCQTPTLTVRPDAFRYTVSVVKITTSERGRELLSESPDTALTTVLKRRDTDFRAYPPVYLQPDETREVDLQKSIDFPERFTPDGKPQGFEHDAVGERIIARLELHPKFGPQVQIDVEDSRISGWRTFPLPEGEQRIPQIKRDAITSALHSKPGAWELIGTINNRTQNDRVHIYLARLDLPGRALPAIREEDREEDFAQRRKE